MKFAAIDIGSNAVRLLISQVHLSDDNYHMWKVGFTRVPIRLGADVFEFGSIGDEKLVQLEKTMKAFWHLMDVHGIEDFRACATSAMREAENRKEVIKHIQNQTNIKIETIGGNEEAQLIFSNFFTQDVDQKGHYLYIDVGGGSTEVTLIKNGERITSKSFAIGTVRILKGKVSKKLWVEARRWVKKLVKKEDRLIAIGTGGNINKIFKEAGKKPYETIALEEIQYIYQYLDSFTYEQRITNLRLRPDRADVILPAADIYYNFMDFAGIEEMIVPKIGLADGIVQQLFRGWQDDQV